MFSSTHPSEERAHGRYHITVQPRSVCCRISKLASFEKLNDYIHQRQRRGGDGDNDGGPDGDSAGEMALAIIVIGDGGDGDGRSANGDEGLA